MGRSQNFEKIQSDQKITSFEKKENRQQLQDISITMSLHNLLLHLKNWESLHL
jgi:hypothetical protein